ncbi:MAG: hypothetical protein Q8898_05925 [Bacillota bacterium]|nr:hypothetical protein [Bacillota bacterium]
MKVCEVCGSVEETEQGKNEVEHRILHLCENCQNDRRYNPFESET